MNIHQLLGRRNETRWLVQLLLLFSGFLGNQTHIEKLVIGSSRGALLHLYHVYQAGSFQQFITFPYKNTFEKKKPGLNLLERAMPVTHHYQHLVCSSSLRPKKKMNVFLFQPKRSLFWQQSSCWRSSPHSHPQLGSQRGAPCVDHVRISRFPFCIVRAKKISEPFSMVESRRRLSSLLML